MTQDRRFSGPGFVFAGICQSLECPPPVPKQQDRLGEVRYAALTHVGGAGVLWFAGTTHTDLLDFICFIKMLTNPYLSCKLISQQLGRPSNGSQLGKLCHHVTAVSAWQNR